MKRNEIVFKLEIGKQFRFDLSIGYIGLLRLVFDAVRNDGLIRIEAIPEGL